MCIRDRHTLGRKSAKPFLEEKGVTMEQKKTCSKLLCCLCQKEDNFTAGENIEVFEESSYLQRCCVWSCISCCLKKADYSVKTDTVNMQILQENKISCLQGVYQTVTDGVGVPIGKVGLPCDKTCLRCTTSCPACLMCPTIMAQGLTNSRSVSYTHLTLPTIYSV
eukprot:TRINITY_DN22208_c0_g2_i1.p1 TRINITY_DN22208_c0_g2~~TRINITY_DN22208_c0_g2_i1.p1  ORF type:complete len:184 (+),score=35.32 TRINITY_DN22208_c0_g2_i1:59-553(+)